MGPAGFSFASRRAKRARPHPTKAGERSEHGPTPQRPASEASTAPPHKGRRAKRARPHPTKAGERSEHGQGVRVFLASLVNNLNRLGARALVPRARARSPQSVVAKPPPARRSRATNAKTPGEAPKRRAGG